MKKDLFLLWQCGELVELYAICHTKMEEIVPSGAAVRYCCNYVTSVGDPSV